MNKKQIALIAQAKVVVRETAYARARITSIGEDYSRAWSAYCEACKLLSLLDPLGAAEFIAATY